MAISMLMVAPYWKAKENERFDSFENMVLLVYFPAALLLWSAQNNVRIFCS
jgi:hypothetical protein